MQTRSMSRSKQAPATPPETPPQDQDPTPQDQNLTPQADKGSEIDNGLRHSPRLVAMGLLSPSSKTSPPAKLPSNASSPTQPATMPKRGRPKKKQKVSVQQTITALTKETPNKVVSVRQFLSPQKSTRSTVTWELRHGLIDPSSSEDLCKAFKLFSSAFKSKKFYVRVHGNGQKDKIVTQDHKLLPRVYAGLLLLYTICGYIKVSQRTALSELPPFALNAHNIDQADAFLQKLNKSHEFLNPWEPTESFMQGWNFGTSACNLIRKIKLHGYWEDGDGFSSDSKIRGL